jgi:hypothetical protein
MRLTVSRIMNKEKRRAKIEDETPKSLFCVNITERVCPYAVGRNIENPK